MNTVAATPAVSTENTTVARLPEVKNPSATSAVSAYVAELQNIQNQKTQLDARETELSQLIQEARNAELRELPQRLGYSDAAEFLRTVAQVNNMRIPGARPAPSANRARSSAVSGRKARVTITPEAREKIKADFKKGKSKEEICDKYDISPAVAQIIKKEAGMVRPHRK